LSPDLLIARLGHFVENTFPGKEKRKRKFLALRHQYRERYHAADLPVALEIIVKLPQTFISFVAVELSAARVFDHDL